VSLVDDWYSQRPSLRAVALRPFSALFGALVALRRALYRGGVRRSVHGRIAGCRHAAARRAKCLTRVAARACSL